MLDSIEPQVALNAILDNNFAAVRSQLMKVGFKVRTKAEAIDALITLMGQLSDEEMAAIISVPVNIDRLSADDRIFLFGPEAQEMYEADPISTRMDLIGPSRSTILNDPLWGSGLDLDDGAPSSPADDPSSGASGNGSNVNWGQIFGPAIPGILDLLFDNKDEDTNAAPGIVIQQPAPQTSTKTILVWVLVVLAIFGLGVFTYKMVNK
jgi:hypothetical protein